MVPDLRGLYFLVMFGLICALLAIGGAVGGLIWFVINHVRIV